MYWAALVDGRMSTRARSLPAAAMTASCDSSLNEPSPSPLVFATSPMRGDGSVVARAVVLAAAGSMTATARASARRRRFLGIVTCGCGSDPGARARARARGPGAGGRHC